MQAGKIRPRVSQVLSAPSPVQVGKFAFVANSRARSVSDTEGLVKFVSDAQTDKILGVHIMGPNAGELISECVLVSLVASWLQYLTRSLTGCQLSTDAKSSRLFTAYSLCM